jgi:hypothetical protein
MENLIFVLIALVGAVIDQVYIFFSRFDSRPTFKKFYRTAILYYRPARSDFHNRRSATCGQRRTL